MKPHYNNLNAAQCPLLFKYNKLYLPHTDVQGNFYNYSISSQSEKPFLFSFL